MQWMLCNNGMIIILTTGAGIYVIQRQAISGAYTMVFLVQAYIHLKMLRVVVQQTTNLVIIGSLITWIHLFTSLQISLLYQTTAQLLHHGQQMLKVIGSQGNAKYQHDLLLWMNWKSVVNCLIGSLQQHNLIAIIVTLRLQESMQKIHFYQ